MKQRLRVTLLDLLATTMFCALVMTVGRMPSVYAALVLASTLALSIATAFLAYWFRHQPGVGSLFRYSFLTFSFLVAYLASFGPACWLMTSPSTVFIRNDKVQSAFYCGYGPAAVCYALTPQPLNNLGFGFLRLWGPDNAINDFGGGVRIVIDGDMSFVGK